MPAPIHFHLTNDEKNQLEALVIRRSAHLAGGADGVFRVHILQRGITHGPDSHGVLGKGTDERSEYAAASAVAEMTDRRDVRAYAEAVRILQDCRRCYNNSIARIRYAERKAEMAAAAAHRDRYVAANPIANLAADADVYAARIAALLARAAAQPAAQEDDPVAPQT
jgi:hypothetical protein